MLRSPRPRRCAVSAPVLAARLVGDPLALLLAAAPARADGPDLVLSEDPDTLFGLLGDVVYPPTQEDIEDAPVASLQFGDLVLQTLQRAVDVLLGVDVQRLLEVVRQAVVVHDESHVL